MKITNTALKCFEVMFKNPARENAKLYEQLPLWGALSYTGVNVYNSLKNIDNNKEESKKDTLNAYAGLAATFGSIFGIGGALIAGVGTKYLCDKAQVKMA